MQLRTSLFCYGTLMFSPVMEAVAGVVPSALHAQLHGYSRYCVRGQAFPGIIAEAGGVVTGVLYLGIRPVELQRLDAYESDFYRRVNVQVHDETGRIYPAFTYVIPENARFRLLQRAWNGHMFMRAKLPSYIRRLRRGIRVT